MREKGIECDFDNKVKAIGMDVLNEAAIDVTGMIKKDFVDVSRNKTLKFLREFTIRVIKFYRVSVITNHTQNFH